MKRKELCKRCVATIFAVVLITLMIVGTTGCGDGTEKIDWSKMKLGTLLPEPKSSVGEIWDNTDEELDIRLNNCSEDEYSDYVKACEAKGYLIDADKRDHSYEAYNNNGFKLSLSLIYDKMGIELTAPMKSSALGWPASALGQAVPAPKSLIGEFEYESANKFLVYVGETTKEDYNEYVKACSSAGFDVDYDKGDRYYRADNAGGYHISLEYEGNNIMSIRANSPGEDASSEIASTDAPSSSTDNGQEDVIPAAPTTAAPTPTDSAPTDAALVDGMRPAFKTSMDEYESFMDEYVAFMKKYKNNPADSTLLADYAKWMSNYADMCRSFEQWEGEDLNRTELAYYVEVQTRVNQKLLEVASA